jgi:DNA-binding NtrC family response regulator
MNSDSKKALLLSRDQRLRNRVDKVFSELVGSAFYLTEPADLLPLLLRESIDIILFHSALLTNGKSEFFEILKTLAIRYPQTQTILLTEPSHISFAASLMTQDNFHYTKLPVNTRELRILLQSTFSNQPQVGMKIRDKRRKSPDRFNLIIGKSARMQQVYRQLQRAAATEIPVLLLGETGTGKDLASQAIHQQSSRRDFPYIPVNLGALPSELVSSELFGHEKGAFTGASQQHVGVFERASKGTVFLDEIDSIDEKVQISLLRLIEQKKFIRLGGKKTINSDARIIAASNVDLEELVQKGRFREDLYYRLDVFRITMPPLREKIEDIPLIIEDFVAKFNQVFNKNVVRVDPECLEILQDYKWPGNVRELKNVVQRAVLLSEGDRLYTHLLPPRLQKTRRIEQLVSFKIGTPLEQIEREVIKKTLVMTHNNRTQAAKLLGITRRALYNKLNKHDLK